MSGITSIRAALETALLAMNPAVDTVFQNQPYIPTPGTPWQRATLMPARPGNIEMGASVTQEQGVFLVMLFYPLEVGPGAAEARAELIRAAFPKKTSLVSGGVVVTVYEKPEIGQGAVDQDRWTLPVRIRYYANV